MSDVIEQNRLPFDADQKTFDTWYNHKMARVVDRNDDLEFVDVNDAVMVFIAARNLVLKHKDKRELFREHTPEALERAEKDLGMFMGITNLAQKVGIDEEEARQAMLDIFR